MGYWKKFLFLQTWPPSTPVAAQPLASAVASPARRCCVFSNGRSNFEFPQGVSCAGEQRGLCDDRTSLVKHIFRIWDSLPPGQQWAAQSMLCQVLPFSVMLSVCQAHHFPGECVESPGQRSVNESIDVLFDQGAGFLSLCVSNISPIKHFLFHGTKAGSAGDASQEAHPALEQCRYGKRWLSCYCLSCFAVIAIAPDTFLRPDEEGCFFGRSGPAKPCSRPDHNFL